MLVQGLRKINFSEDFFLGDFYQKEEKRADWWIEWVLWMGVKEDRETLEKKYEEFIKIQRRNYKKRKRYSLIKGKTEYYLAQYSIWKAEEKLKKLALNK